MKNKLLMGFVILAGLISLASADIGDGNFGGCGVWGGMMGSYGFGAGIFSWLISVLFIVALILLIFWLIKQIQKK
ncbi:hypothetical protein J4402_04480 [Candidatus Pacearchaeota archaeon]|nr:hypothetical protein [Candidatus Pacearchaeota archaeon]